MRTFEKSLNSTFVALIPKKGSMEDLKEFKPISLVDNQYKILAKVLANRLKKWLGKWCQILKMRLWKGNKLDVVLIANEPIDSRLRSQRESCV